MATTEVDHHRKPVMSFEQALAEVSAYEAEAESITPGPCPAWCDLPSGHKYAAVGIRGEAFVRFHQLHVTARVTVEAEESLSVDGVVAHQPADVWLTDVSDPLTPAEAHELGDDLNTAARRCEEIRAAAQS